MAENQVLKLPELLQQGLSIYKDLKDKMQKALGFKEYAEQLSHITQALRGVNEHLDDKERAIVETLDKAYDIAQEAMRRATLVVATIKEQSAALVDILSDSGEHSGSTMWAACMYFSGFATEIKVEIEKAEEALQNASNVLYRSLDDIKSIIDTLKRVHDQFLAEKRAAEARARAVAYGSAAVGLLAGPIGLIISYSIAAGVTEGLTIPQIEADFAQQREKMAGYISGFEKMHTETEELKEQIDEKLSLLLQIHAKIGRTGSMAKTASKHRMPVDPVRRWAEDLVKACEEFLATLQWYPVPLLFLQKWTVTLSDFSRIDNEKLVNFST